MNSFYAEIVKLNRSGEVISVLDLLDNSQVDWRFESQRKIAKTYCGFLNSGSQNICDFEPEMKISPEILFDISKLKMLIENLKFIQPDFGNPNSSIEILSNSLFSVLRQDIMHWEAWKKLITLLENDNSKYQVEISRAKSFYHTFVKGDNSLFLSQRESDSFNLALEKILLSDIKVGYIIPVFNENPKFVKETLESVLNQKCNAKVGVILIDDGSNETDFDYQKLVRQYFQESVFNNRLFLIRKENGGGAALTRNYGLKCAFNSPSLEYIGFVDSSDLLLPTKTQIQLNHFDENLNLGLVHGKASIIYRGDNLFDAGNYFEMLWKNHNSRIINLESPYDLVMGEGSRIHAQTPLFKVDLLKKAGYQNIFWPRGQDRIYWETILRLNPEIKFLNKILSLYRVQDLNLHYF